jgi:hypothetical protein
MDKYELKTITNWHQYQYYDGKMDFEDFYGRSLKTQASLIRICKWRRH